MKAIVNRSKVVLITALLSLGFSGCDRNAADQTGAAGTSGPATPSSSTAVVTGGATTTTPGTSGSTAAAPSGTADSTAGTTASTPSPTAGAAGSTTASPSGTASSPAGTSGASSSDAASSGPASSSTADSSSGASGTKGASAGAVIDDSIITTKVKTALMADSDVKARDINVETKQGEVLLSGAVGSQTEMDKAVKVANAIDGVKGVSNKMSVKQ